MDSAVLQVDAPSNVDGYAYVGLSGIWIVNHDHQSVTLKTDLEETTYDISDLCLSSDDRVLNVDFIVCEETIFICTKRRGSLAAFLVSLRQPKTGIPRTLSFAVNSLIFHQNVMACFVVVESLFCVISSEGISVHGTDLRDVFSLMTRVTTFCRHKSCVTIFDAISGTLSICKADGRGGMSVLRRLSEWKDGPPSQIIELANSLVIVVRPVRQASYLRVVLFTDATVKMCQYHDMPEDPGFAVTDDLVVVLNKLTGSCCLIDVDGERCVGIGPSFDFVPGVVAIWESKLVLTTSAIQAVRVNFGTITKCSILAIASLFRRRRGLQTGLHFLGLAFQNVRGVESLLAVIVAVAPSVVDSTVGQIGFANSLMYCEISDPHMILLGMLEFSKIVGPSLVDEARRIVMKAICHPGCRPAIRGLFSCAEFRMDIDMIRRVMDECGDAFVIDIHSVVDILDYAEVCLEYNRVALAKRILFRAVLDSVSDEERLAGLKRRAELL